MTIVRVSDASLVERLLADLQARPDVIADVVGPNRVRISLLGSYNQEAMALAILLRVRAWEAGQRARGVAVDVEIE
jgi:hypothetical protein